MKHYLKILIATTLLIPVWTTARADLLWNQAPSGWGKFSSVTVYHSWVADDFTMDTSSLIDTVTWWGGRGGQTPVIDGFSIRFYSNGFDASSGHNFADQLLYEQYVTGDANQTAYNSETYEYSTSLTGPFNVTANEHYWISIQADTSSDPNNIWWGWQEAASTNLDPAEFNGGNYSHHPINATPFYHGNHDMAFELDGSPAPVPEPATLLLFGTGMTGMIVLRRKNRSI